MEIETFSSGSPRHIPLRLTDVLFQVGQEAIANALRHASATEIKTRLEYLHDKVQLSIEDNGIGFIPGDSSVSGFGLNGIRSRMQTVGGTLRILSSIDGGTRLMMEAPLHKSIPLLKLRGGGRVYFFRHHAGMHEEPRNLNRSELGLARPQVNDRPRSS